MAFTDHLADANWDKVYLLEIEVGHSIADDVWTQDGGNPSWWILHPEGEPSKVEEDGVAYTERANLADCNTNPSSWFWDSGNERLYVHTSGSDDPGGASYIILAFIWEYYANDSPVNFNGNYYLPYINDEDVHDIKLEVFGYQKGGVIQSFGTIRMLNADGYFDTRLSDYVYEAKSLVWKVGKKGDGYGDFITLWIGWTGSNRLNDEWIEIDVEDLRLYI